MGKGLGKLIRTFGALIATLFFCGALLAQTGDGTVRGQITDQSGAVIPAIEVTLVSPGGATQSAQTDEQGHYAFHRLAPGAYTLRVDIKGFAPFLKDGVAVAAGGTQTVNAQLVVAMETQQVNVQGEANRVSVTASSNVSSLVLKGKDLESLSDDPDELSDELNALAGPAAGPNGGQIYIDGFEGGQLPPKSEILEIRVNQNPFSAQYDRLGYGRIEITTKPGSQKFHGQAFAFGNTSVLNSRNPFVTEQPAYHSVFSSGNIGGPIGKKAAFFFDMFRRDVNDNAIIKAEVLDPTTFQPIPFSQAVANSGMRMHLNPRVDFQLSDRNVLSIRTEFSQDSDNNGGIGQFSLPSQAYNTSGHEFEIHATDTQVISARTVNQLRFGFERSRDQQTPLNLGPTINVRGAFNGGASNQGTSNNIQKHLEVNNMTSMSLGKHSVSFGGRLRNITQSANSTQGFNGTFTFASLAAYQVVQQGLAQSLTVPTIISNCLATQDPANPNPSACGPDQFVMTVGNPLATVSRWDVGVYGEDEWRMRPNVSLTMGLRFESQNGIHDHADFAPRIGLAWGLGRSAKPQTVLRAGFGVFYDRFDDDYMLQADRLNGITEQRYVVNLPDFFPTIPSVAALAAANSTSPTVYRVSPTLRAPYTMQTGIGLERQLGKAVTTSVTYVNSHGVHQLLTRNINAPLPGTYDPLVPSSGTRPFGDIGNIYEYETAGLYNQNQIISNFNIRAGARLSLNGFYTLSYANSNAVGGGFPSNQYNIRQDYGPAPFVVRHQVFLGGSAGLPKGFRLSPFMVINSGRPYSVTIGEDLNGDSVFNDRPAFAAAGATGPNIVSTPLGVFNTAPTTADTVVPPNYLFGPSQFSLNARLAKTFGFGRTREGGGGPGGGWHSHDRGLGGRGLSGGGGGGGPFGGPSSDNHRYQLEFSIMGRNVFNKVNLAPPVGTLSSPFFGQSIQLAGGFFGSQSSNRSLNLMMRFSF